MLKISVIVPTFNRANEIKDTLDCLIDQKTNNEFGYEIIVVDNNSRDHTKEVLEPYASRFPRKVTYLFEPSQGKSYALNSAIRIAQGEIIACVDDDCIVDDTYLANINKVFLQYGQEVGVLGGRIYPKWLGGPPPAWLDKIFAQPFKLENGALNWPKLSFEGVLGVLDFGNEPFVLDYSQKYYSGLQFFGANMAFRKKTLELHGGFDVTKRIGEDTEVCERLFNAGVKGIYAPSVRVYHKTPTSKGRPAFFYKWWYGRGIHMDLQEKFSVGFILKTGGLFLESFSEKELFNKIQLRWKGFFNLGQMMKLVTLKARSLQAGVSYG